jgi:hypothetical protein
MKKVLKNAVQKGKVLKPILETTHWIKEETRDFYFLSTFQANSLTPTADTYTCPVLYVIQIPE